MSEKRATTSGGYAKTPESKTEPMAKLGDHLGRLLSHADRLLAEWQAHADGLRARFEAEARASGDALARTLAAALTDVQQAAGATFERDFGGHAASLRGDLERARQAAADLEAHMRRIAGGAKPTSVDELRAGLHNIQAQLHGFAPEKRGALLFLGVSANLLAAAVLVFLVTRKPEPRPEPPAPTPAPIIVASVPDAGPPPKPVAPVVPCGAVTVEGVATAARVAAACVTSLCPQKLAECRPDGAAGDLVAALRSLERDKALSKLGCPLPPKAETGGYIVTVRWLLDCPSAK